MGRLKQWIVKDAELGWRGRFCLHLGMSYVLGWALLACLISLQDSGQNLLDPQVIASFLGYPAFLPGLAFLFANAFLQEQGLPSVPYGYTDLGMYLILAIFSLVFLGWIAWISKKPGRVHVWVIVASLGYHLMLLVFYFAEQ